MPVESSRSFIIKALSASPLGVIAFLGGLVLTIVFVIRFDQILDGVDNADLAAAIQALEFTVVSVWIGVSLWGWYLVKDGLERMNNTRRLNEQAQLLSRIHEAIEERDAEKAHKQELTQKSRSFWNWRRGDS